MTRTNGSTDDPELSDLDPMLVEHAAELAMRLRRGERIDPADLDRLYPEHAEALLRLLPTIEMMAAAGALAEDGGDPLEARALPAAPDESAATLGDFRLIREIGRGGMGIVYEAIQVSLGRRVALKVLPLGATLDPRLVQRFQLEAQAAAFLHHPNIVPVYSVGSRRGVPYYAMQYIEGRSLAEVIHGLRLCEEAEAGAASPGADSLALRIATELTSGRFSRRDAGPEATPLSAASAGTSSPSNDGATATTTPSRSSIRSRSYARTVARLGLQAAEALAYAHEQGVVHRDIKPANLLIDHRGDLWVTDFGLARTRTNPAMSSAGALVGTLRYMSPEQARTRRAVVDHRTDVYSLGVTLYELLTLRPAIAGHDSKEILRQIAEQEPRQPRKLNPAVAVDLQTIVTKAMAKDTGDRYATALELADDLRRFLELKPVRARRPSLMDRAGKWGHRNRATAALALAILVLTTAGLAASNRMISRERDEAERLSGVVARKHGEARLQSTELMLDKGLAFCERGDIGLGVLWLGRALEAAPPDSRDLARVIRANLAAWSVHLPRLKAILPCRGAVYASAFSPDGASALTGSRYRDGLGREAHEARLWDVATGRRIGGIPEGRGGLIAASFNGRTAFARGSGDNGDLWDLRAGKTLGAPLTCQPVGAQPPDPFLPSTPVMFGVFSPDGKAILTTRFRALRRPLDDPFHDGLHLWDAATGEPLGVEIQTQGAVFGAIFSPDGKRILTAGRGRSGGCELRLWDAATGQPLKSPLPVEGKALSALAFSPDGETILAGGLDGMVRRWDAADWRPVGPALPHQGAVASVAVSPDGKRILAASNYGRAWRWDAATGEPLGLPIDLQGPAWSLAFGPDGRTILTGGNDGSARLWEDARQPLGLALEVSPRQYDSTKMMAFRPSDGAVCLGGADWVLRLWDSRTGRPLGELPGQVKGSVAGVAFSPDGKSLLIERGGSIVLLDSAGVRVIGRLLDLTLTEDGVMRPAGAEGQEEVRHLAFSPDGRTLMAVGDRMIWLWDAATRNPRCAPLAIERGLDSAQFSIDSRTLLVAGPWNARAWDVATGHPLGPSITHHEARINAVALSPDGKRILTANLEGETLVWDVVTGRSLAPPFQQESAIVSGSFSPDGGSVFTVSHAGNGVALDATTGAKIGSFLRTQQPIEAAAFSPDGKTVLVGTHDGTTRLWDLATGRQLGPAVPIGTPAEMASRDGRPALDTNLVRRFGPNGLGFSPDGKVTVATCYGERPKLGRVPEPQAGTPEQLVLWTEVLTGRELNERGEARVLDADDWVRRRVRLENMGGPRLP